MELNLDIMLMTVRQMPLLIVALTVIVQLVAVLQRRNRLVLEQKEAPGFGP